jgi:hypothetical protein
VKEVGLPLSHAWVYILVTLRAFYEFVVLPTLLWEEHLIHGWLGSGNVLSHHSCRELRYVRTIYPHAAHAAHAAVKMFVSDNITRAYGDRWNYFAKTPG